ncbi:MAG: fumarate hydratase C-terminal domain-containing protein [Spirochaetaceae bacterium]|jgi:fumarate hydratase subunit beta|nr:fumarate hydratase C-terminal domain-containing protein [Spirochaetaceae bacterium]
MCAEQRLTTPLTTAAIEQLNAGDLVELSGIIYTARDAAHERFATALAAQQALPLDFKNQIIFYAGPSPARPGRIIGSIAPTTSIRMDRYLEMTYQLGIAGTIGKGERSAHAAELCKSYRRVFFLSYGGIAALIARTINACEIVAYNDLGTESVKRLIANKLKLVVGIDARGTVFNTAEIQKYRR